MDELHQLRKENEWLKRENQELCERLTVAETTIKQLTELLGQNSRNSSWPSSRDKIRQKPKPKSLRPKTDRKPGGQEGHSGHTLEFNAKPDIIEVHRPAECQHCQTPLSNDMAASAVSKRQVLDLPPLRFVTTKQQEETLVCPCYGETIVAEFPASVSHPVHLTVCLGTSNLFPTNGANSYWLTCLNCRFHRGVYKTLSRQPLNGPNQ